MKVPLRVSNARSSDFWRVVKANASSKIETFLSPCSKSAGVLVDHVNNVVLKNGFITSDVQEDIKAPFGVCISSGINVTCTSFRIPRLSFCCQLMLYRCY